MRFNENPVHLVPWIPASTACSLEGLVSVYNLVIVPGLSISFYGPSHKGKAQISDLRSLVSDPSPSISFSFGISVCPSYSAITDTIANCEHTRLVICRA